MHMGQALRHPVHARLIGGEAIFQVFALKRLKSVVCQSRFVVCRTIPETLAAAIN